MSLDILLERQREIELTSGMQAPVVRGRGHS